MHWRRALAAGLSAALAGCQLPAPAEYAPRTAEPPFQPPPPRLRRLPELVPVRISECERSESVRIGGAREGELSFTREGGGVRASDGRRAPSFELHPNPAEEGLRFAERTYSGSLVVEPHVSGGLSVTNRVPLEDYVAGVVAAELVLWSALPAELEAQAIAARTYAARALEERGAPRPGAFLWDDTRDQVYRGRFMTLPTARAREVAARLESAVRATRGTALVRRGRLLDARFHASCGGYTAALADVFPAREAESWPQVACAPCARIAADTPAERPAGGAVRWEFTAGEAELARLAAALRIGRRIVALRPVRVDEGGRWIAIELEGEWARQRMELDELRQRLGPARLASGRIVRTWPPPEEAIRGGLFFEGLGRGHGVGLCQIGAREYAREGWSAERILSHYYPGARAVRVLKRSLAQAE